VLIEIYDWILASLAIPSVIIIVVIVVIPVAVVIVVVVVVDRLRRLWPPISGNSARHFWAPFRFVARISFMANGSSRVIYECARQWV